MAVATSIQQQIATRSALADRRSKYNSREFRIQRVHAEECIQDSAFISADGYRHYTMSQISRHNSINSAWLVAGDKIYDATSYLQIHPGGEASILRKSGGVCDCTEDFQFHSKKGRKLWQKHFVGKVKACPDYLAGRQWWQFWM
jgi:cytochrome b involved in lipid metabolism